MRLFYIRLSTKNFYYLLSWGIFCAVLLGSTQIMAQQSALSCNADTRFSAPTISNLAVSTTAVDGIGIVYWEDGSTCSAPFNLLPPCGENGKDNATSSSTSDFARVHFLSAGGSARLRVTESVNTYSGGNFAGFIIRSSSLVGAGLFGTVTVATYNNGGFVEASSSSSLLGVNSSLVSGAYEVGFITTQPFDAIEIRFSGLVNAQNFDVFSAIQRKFCAGPELVCNTPTILDESIYPVAINPANTGIITNLVCAACGVDNPANVIDGSSSTAAVITTTAGVATTASVGVKNQLQTYPINTFVGFDVENTSLLSADLLGGTTITLYNNGSAVQTATSSNGLLLGASSSILTSSTRQTIGVVSTVPAFDEVKISFISPVRASVSITSIYSAIIQRACEAPLACSQTYQLTNPTFPSVINSARTGVTGDVCAACVVNNPGNLINASLEDFATLTAIAGLGAQSSISVLDPVGTYPAGSYAGFVINRPVTIVDLALLNDITITTYYNGVLSESKTSGNLLDLTLLFDIFGGGNPPTFNIGFVTTKPFDEMQISVGALGGVNRTVNVYSAFIDTRTAFGAGLRCFKANPDFAVTLKSVPVSGSVKTNDIVGAGTTYGPPVGPVSSPAGSMPVLTVNVDGTYTFNSATPGVYVYQVTVCPPSQTTACPTSLFTITVLDPTVSTNPPVANVDYASVQGSITSPGSVTVDVDANDGPGNIGGTLTTPTIVGNPTNGTASIDPATGKLIYTPTAGYFGVDLLTYQVCESPGGLCATAQVTLTVNAPGSSSVTTIDDYASTAQNISVTGNVLTNDLGTNLTVSNSGSVTVPGKGTLVLTSTGSYTFTPVTNVTGPVDFTYTACDNSAPTVCGTATLHLLVVPAPDLTPIVFARPSTVNGTTPITVVVDVFETKSVPTNRLITVKVTKDASYTLSFDQMATSVNGRSVQNSAWSYQGLVGGSYTFTTTNVIAGDVGTGKLSFGMTGTLTPGATTGVVTVTSVIVGGSGGESNTSNNSDADRINYFQQ